MNVPKKDEPNFSAEQQEMINKKKENETLAEAKKAEENT